MDGHTGTGEDGGDGLLPGHGGALGNVVGAVGNFPVQHGAVPDGGIHAHVTYGDAHTKMLAQGGGTGFGPGQVDGLL